MLPKNDILLSIVFDNYLFKSAIQQDLKTLWGFSCYIETPQKTILFDTGSNGRVLLSNMQSLKKSVKSIDTIFLSHQHWDHIGGLDSIIELNPDIEIIAPSSISKLMLKDLTAMVAKVTIIGAAELQFYQDIYSTGLMGDDVMEQSMLIDSDEGLIIITGCAHSGIVDIVKKAQQIMNKKVALLMGGFHLMEEDTSEIMSVINELKKFNIDYLCPTHCTGDTAKALFQKNYNKPYIEGGVGKIIA